MSTDKKNKNAPQEEPAKNAQQTADELAALMQKLDALENEKSELFQQLQRLSADYANFQKRAPRQIADSVAYEKEAIIRSLLPALDNFDQARASFQKEMTVETMQKGVEILHSHLLDILRSHGVEAIEAKGKRFDPAMHQAIMQQQDPEQDDGIILTECQKGYKLADRVVRPAKVIVNKLTSRHQPSEDETTDTQ